MRGVRGSAAAVRGALKNCAWSVRGPAAAVRGSAPTPHTPSQVFALVWNGMDNGFNRSSTMDSSPLVPVEVDGQPLNEWATANEIGRSTAYSFLALVKGRGFEPEKTRGGGSKPLVILSGAVLDLMNLLLADHRRGMSLPEIRRKYETSDDASVAIAPVASTAAALTTIVQTEPTPSAEDPDHSIDDLLQRLNAAAMAQTTGLPLTKKELQWIIGAGISSETAAMARCRIEKLGRRWTLLPPSG